MVNLARIKGFKLIYQRVFTFESNNYSIQLS